MYVSRRSFFKLTAKAAAVSIFPSFNFLGIDHSDRLTEYRDNTGLSGESGEENYLGLFTADKVNKITIPGEGIFSKAELSPSRVNAGENVEFIITLTVGRKYTRGPSRIIFDYPCLLGQSRPSLMHHEDYGYLEIYMANPNVTYTHRTWDIELGDFTKKQQGSFRNMGQRISVLDISEGLKYGDVIELHWGDNQRGFGPGTNITCVVPKPDYENIIYVRYFDDPSKGLPDLGRSYKGYQRPVPKLVIPLIFKVSPRPVHHFRLYRKVDKAMLVPNDRYWNVAQVEDISTLVGTPEKGVKNSSGVFEYANKNVRILSKRLPLLDTPNMDHIFENLNIYWGELHSHSIYSKDVIERERMEMKPDELMRVARERSGLDFYSVSDHHQPWDTERRKIGRENWEKTIQAVRQNNKPGEFVVFPSLEFRSTRGDTIITFGWLPDYDEIDRTDWKDIRDVWAGLKGRNYLTHPHFHNPGQLKKGEWWENIDSGVEPMLEIFSCHGSYEREDALENSRALIKRFRSDRNGSYFISQGYHYGLVSNSDSHKGHVGLNGLTAVFSESLDRKSIFDAYRKRHIYGTTNARIRLIFTGNGKLMGSVLPNSEEKVFTIDVFGENKLKKVDLFRNGKFFKRFIPRGVRFKKEFMINEHDPSNWYVRVTQVDNQIAFSSPVWFE